MFTISRMTGCIPCFFLQNKKYIKFAISSFQIEIFVLVSCSNKNYVLQKRHTQDIILRIACIIAWFELRDRIQEDIK